MGKKQREKKARKIAQFEAKKEELKKNSAEISLGKIFRSFSFYLYLICIIAIGFYPFFYDKYVPHGKYATLYTSKGEIEIQLYRDKAPKTVDNFIDLAKSGFYQNLIWHRVVKNFIIQTGDPTGTGSGGAGRQVDDEISDLSFIAGTVGMANSGKNTNDSQFFITVADVHDSLDGKYTAFARVIKGLEVAKEISEMPTDDNERPLEDVLLNNVKIR